MADTLWRAVIQVLLAPPRATRPRSNSPDPISLGPAHSQPRRATEQSARPHSSQMIRTPANCMVPGFDGALFSLEWKDALWAKFYMGAPARRRQCVARS